MKRPLFYQKPACAISNLNVYLSKRLRETLSSRIQVNSNG